MIKVIPKKASLRLAKGLTSREFCCRCDNDFCTATVIDNQLVKSYGKFRELVGVRLTINSGYRCPAHNFAVGGTSLSRHQLGQAIDISLKTLDHLSNDDIEHAARRSGFTFIKFYKSFIHMDVRNTKGE